MSPVLMNNCRGRDHVEHFGRGAFFDLFCQGKQAKMGTDIVAGDVCIVATQDEHRRIATFEWFKLSHERNMRDKKGLRCRVFFGKQLKSKTKTMPKKEAAKAPLYGAYFNKRDDFKQMSIIPY
jgi:hypothetical protein